MNFRTTGVLLVLVALGVALWWFTPARDPEVGGSRAARSEPPAARYVLEPQPLESDIARVVLERGERRLVFERPPKADDPNAWDEWRMVEPVAAPAEQYMVSDLAGRFARLRSQSTLPLSQLSLKDAGLDPPAARVTLVDRAGRQHVVEVGRKTAVGEDTYVRTAGADLVHIVDVDLTRDVQREAKEYRSKTLAKFSVADVVRLTIEHEGTTSEFQKNEKGEWVINSPVRAYADADKLRALINRLTTLRVAEFIEDQPAALGAYGLEPPHLRLLVTSEQRRPRPADPAATQPAEPGFETHSQTFELLVGAHADIRQENRFVKLGDQPWVASASAAQTDGLVPRLGELRDARVTRIREADVTKLELSTGGQTAVLERSAGRWQGSGDLAELEREAVRDVVQALEDLRAIDYVDQPGSLSAYGLDPPRAMLRATVSGLVEPLTIRVGTNTASGRNTYVQVEGHPSVLVVSESQARRLVVEPLALRSRKIFDEDADAIVRIEVQRRGRQFSLVREPNQDSTGPWTLAAPAGAPVDADSARELAGTLARLYAKRVLARDGEDQYGLARPEMVVRFVVRSRTAPLEAGAPEPEPSSPGQPAGASSEPQVTQGAAPAPATEPQALAQEGSEPQDRVEETASQSPESPQAGAHTVEVSRELRVARRGGQTCASRDGAPFVYELDETVYRVLAAELIDRRLVHAAADEVVGVRIESAGGLLEFSREGTEWKFVPDPTVKPAQTKVKDLVADLTRLRVESYVDYSGGDASTVGLSQAPLTVVLRLRDGATMTLRIDPQAVENSHLAGWVEQARTFRLNPADVEKLTRSLDYYLTAEKPAAPAPAAPPEE